MIGSCLCETVKFELKGRLPNLYQCHCSACRKITGSASNTGMLLATSQFSWLSGEDKLRLYVKESGYHAAFCGCCGSPMPNILRNGQGYWVPAGALPDGNFEVVANLCIADKASWNRIGNGGVNFNKLPDINELISLLKPKD